MSSRARNTIVIGGRFQLVRKIGEGGMGVVWEAVELARPRPCAIKFVRPATDEEASRRRFLREAEVLRGISHPNIVATYEIATDDDGTLALVMELLSGESLAERLERKRYLSVGQTAAILSKVVTAVNAAHALGVVHRDLKPDNVFLCVDDRGNTNVRVVDFGVAKKVEALPDKLTETGTLVGTPQYMSPEQAGGEKLDNSTDVWSVSVIAFECLSGYLPVAGENYGQLLARLIRREITKLAAVRPDLPPDLVAAIDAGLAPRENRPSLDRLATILASSADTTIESPPITSTRTTGDRPAPVLMPSASGAAPTIIDAAPAASLPKGVVHAVVGFALVAIATLTAGLVVHLRARSSSSPTTATTAVVVSSASVASAASETTVASSSAVVDVSSDSPSPTSASASAAPRLAAKQPPIIKPRSSMEVGPGPGPAKPATSPGRLQGGVGGDVPF